MNFLKVPKTAHAGVNRRDLLAGAVTIVPAAGLPALPAVASDADGNLRQHLRSLLDRLRIDTKCTIAVHYDRQMIGSEIQAMLGEGGEPWQLPDSMEIRINAWASPSFMEGACHDRP